MVFFGYPKQHFGFQSSLWVKINLDLIVRWNEWIKLMYIQCKNYNFSTAIGFHVCGSWNITKKNKIEKIMQCPSIKSPLLWYGSVFFLKRRYYYAFIIQKWKNYTIFQWNFIQNL
jgi:hypothetical protein